MDAGCVRATTLAVSAKDSYVAVGWVSYLLLVEYLFSSNTGIVNVYDDKTINISGADTSSVTNKPDDLKVWVFCINIILHIFSHYGQ
jgi:hypothetical protein